MLAVYGIVSAQILGNASTTVCQIAIIEAFIGLKDPRRRAGQRHTLPLCLALFTPLKQLFRMK
ncbi:hypothetical protein [Nostoc sp. ChiQUE01b]|uniref:hypothetical protein n=1 Tax=Nostoc sp. ChiQUE01b TaxID=3075376 RepID=UPI002AD4AAC7|nr:hypothetical protein [Nostoc sp. ChiQUE01b]MDZ8262278.1 hypothetical protein [Nostoc sp. ChiQUE01b]